MTNNIFSDLSEKITSLRESRRQTAGGKLLTVIQKEKNQDARMWLIFCVILTVASVLTAYLGYKYYHYTFAPSYPGAAVLMAVALAGLVELGKVWLAYDVLSGIFFGWAFRNWFKAGAYLFAGILAFGIYRWSYRASTEGVAIYAKETSMVNMAPPSLTTQLNEATATVDQQIAQISGGNEKAASMKTKKGRINWYGQQALANNSTTLSSLQQQRADIVRQTMADYEKQNGRIETKTNALSEYVQRFGGYSEWAVLFCLLAMVFFDRNANDELTNTPTAQKVMQKLKEHSAQLSAAEMDEELKKAATMNGTYKEAPLPGKM